MGKSLIIVESPAKVKTIKKFLGPGYMVQASVGHIRDLPKSSIGVDETNNFAPAYEVIAGKEKIVQALRDAAAKVDTVYLAPDPDREGEAIAWHIAELVKDKNLNIKRIQFNEITSRAVHEALENPRDLNVNLFDAQQARRVLDRLVGYKISPLLWTNVKRGISAGRVQSVALRLIVEREEERCAFIPEEYWLFKAILEGATPPPFKAELWKVEGKKPVIADAAAAETLEAAMKGKPCVVSAVDEKERSRSPQPPFITSTLQQAANQRFGYPAKRTMNIAQRLYEGLELGERGTTALITYMRTDSVRIADEAQKAAAAFITERFGKASLAPGGKRTFKGKAGAQDAHEAVRPIDVTLTPDDVKPYLAPDQYQVYRLIWSRFVASQMAAARFHDTTVVVDCGPAQWRAKGERLLFPGFLAALPRSKDEESSELPPLAVGETLKCNSLTKEQKFTQPAPRFTEASLVRELEELGIGRPSTYAAIISTLQDRDYVHLEEKHFAPTDLGQIVCDRLREHFKTLMDVRFTAHMEELLDKVADGEQDWVVLLRDFSKEFNPALLEAAKSMGKEKTDTTTDIPCPDCGKPLAVKFGKTGQFLACTGYPTCRFTSNYTRDEQGKIALQDKVKPVFEKVGVCPDCGKDLVLKKARTGSRFIACTGYPDCKHAEPFSTGVPCPREGCDGMLVEKSSKRGKIFYSCGTYPKCDYALWDWPVPEPCPECGSPLLVLKNTKAKGKYIACPVKTCKYVRELPDEGEGEA
ncbi:MAG: type I DNA topoisomerase [Bilophila sp.]